MKKPTLTRFIQPPKFTASPGVIAGIEEKSPVDFFLLFFSSKILRLINTKRDDTITKYYWINGAYEWKKRKTTAAVKMALRARRESARASIGLWLRLRPLGYAIV